MDSCTARGEANRKLAKENCGHSGADFARSLRVPSRAPVLVLVRTSNDGAPCTICAKTSAQKTRPLAAVELPDRAHGSAEGMAAAGAVRRSPQTEQESTPLNV